MAIALSPFRAFLNFVPPPVLLQHLLTVPELKDIVPEDAIDKLAKSLNLSTSGDAVAKAAEGPFEEPNDAQKEALKAVFSAVMHAEKPQYEGAIDKLVKRYQSGKVAASEEPLRELVLTLNEQYPADVGTLCVFLLNVVDLETGQAVFLGANVPHAYICGDIIECMATSDNVVRAGLTPKLRDVPTLVDMLTYEAGPADKQKLQPSEFNRDPATLIYDPPIEEFSVLRVHLAKDELTTHRPIDGPSIVIITNGEALIKWEGSGSIPVARGDVVFLGAGVEYKWQATKDTEAFRAFVEA
jgi:mannose-6-phosphate isomerase